MLLSIRGGSGRRSTGLWWTARASITASTLLGVNLWAYLKARGDGALSPGRPQKLQASSSDGSSR
jgi:hypothetical protein